MLGLPNVVIFSREIGVVVSDHNAIRGKIQNSILITGMTASLFE
jgi:hypothetical protein